MTNETTWMGKIPESWKSIPLKYVFDIQKRIAGKEGYTVLSITQSGIKPKNMDAQGQYAQDYSNYQLVYPGDFAMNHMDLLTGWVDISQYEGVTSPDYRVFVNRDADRFCSAYYKYIFQYCYYNKVFYGMGQGVSGFGRWRLPADMFLNFRLPVPSLDEQKRIATFLEQKICDIDVIVAEAKASIKEYKAWKASIIYEAVTKGIDPNVEMKDSGVEWIGAVPKHWQKKRLKDYYKFEKGKNAAQYTKEYIGLHSGEYPVYSGQTENNGVMGNIDTYDYDIEECLFTTTVGAKVMTPKILRGKFSLSQNCLIMLPHNVCDNYFFYYALFPLFAYAKSLIPSYMQPSLRIEDLNKYSIFAPDVEEQKHIATYLDNICSQIDAVIADKQTLISDLGTYKKSLIFEVVTGKRRVME